MNDADAPREDSPAPHDSGPAGRPRPDCPDCGTPMRFDGGESTHDLWAERYTCPICGRITYRSFGRGSV